MPKRPEFLSRPTSVGAAVTLILFAVVAGAIAIALANFGNRGAAENVSLFLSAAGLAVAVGAVVAAVLTINQQEVENRRQREMTTLHQVNEQYEKIFDDIYDIRAKVLRRGQLTGDAAADAKTERELLAKIDKNDIKRAYNRFFTTVMTGFRYYQLGFIPREDFQEWTATLIGRFVKQECIVRAFSLDPCPLLAHWNDFDSWARGPRTAFRAYMTAVLEEVGKLKAKAPTPKEADPAELKRIAEEKERTARLQESAAYVVNGIGMAAR